MRLLPKSIHRCRRYPTKFNSGRDIPFSYGFRPGRNPHNALDALYVGIMRKRVNWMLDADIRGFFDAITTNG